VPAEAVQVAARHQTDGISMKYKGWTITLRPSKKKFRHHVARARAVFSVKEDEPVCMDGWLILRGGSKIHAELRGINALEYKEAIENIKDRIDGFELDVYPADKEWEEL